MHPSVRRSGLLLPLVLVLSSARSIPESLVLGSGERAEVVVPNAAAHVARANLGTLTPLGHGAESRFRYEPPPEKAPQTAVLLFVGAPPPGRDGPLALPPVAVVRVPLLGRRELSVVTRPNALVRVLVAGRSFGPARASASGRLKVPIEVPPGTQFAEVVAEDTKQSTRVAVPLDVPPRSPPVAAISPARLTEGSAGYLVIAHDEPLDVRAVQLDAPADELRLLGSTGGALVYRLEPPAGRDAWSTRIRWSDGKTQQVVTIEASVRVAQRPKPPELPAPVPPAPPPQLAPLPLGVSVQTGPYLVGSSLGHWSELSTSYALLSRLALELSVGLFTASPSGSTLVGPVRSSVLAFPVTVNARARVLQSERWALDVRAGAGALPYSHASRIAEQPEFFEQPLSFALAGSVQGALRLQPVELYLEVRGVAAPLRTQRLDTSAGGTAFGLGARYPGR